MNRTYQRQLLEPELRKIAKYTPPVDFSDVDKARKGINKMYRFLPKVDETDVVIEDKLIRSQTSNPPVKVRTYYPKGLDRKPKKSFFKKVKKLPAMLFMHWGGFCLGDLRTEHARCIRLCRDVGMLIISVEYRLAPENPFPAGLDDCYSVLLWLESNSEELMVDTEKIAVGGTSAGAGLAAGLALKARDEKGPKIAFQYLGFPVLDNSCSTESAQSFEDTPNWTAEANRLMWKYYMSEEKHPDIAYASPQRAESLLDLPYTYLWTAEFDPLRDEGLIYAQKLMHAGVPVELHCYTGTMHGFDSSPNADGVVLRAQEDQVKAIKKQLSIF